MKFLADLPRPTAIGFAVLAATLVLFAILFPLLGGAQENAEADLQKLTREVAQLTKDIAQAGTDYKYVVENKEQFDALMAGDRLIPHARRAAIRQLQTLALARGLTSLNYSFIAAGEQSLKAMQSQPTGGDYRVSVENIDLKIGAPLDTQIFDFALDLGEAFPGFAIVQVIDLQRSPTVSQDMLDKVSAGQDSGLVKGEIILAWRTAQANEKKDGKETKGK